jgi:hypothetical protein
MLTVFRFVHPSKACWLIRVMLAGMLTDVKLVLFANALLSIPITVYNVLLLGFVTLAGITIL